MDLGKKVASNFSGALTRAKQYTQEKLGTSDKTGFDKQFEEVEELYEKTKLWTEKILARVETVFQANQNVRFDDLLEKLDKKRERQTPLELLAQDMIDAGNDLGSDKYGESLITTGKTFLNISHSERECTRSIQQQYIQPLKKFLHLDVKAVLKERKMLEMKRLDLDACKSKLKKLKLAETNLQAEQELRIAQTEYDRQLEITKLLLDGISSIHANHMRCLHDFVEIHLLYYGQCQQYMADLQRQLST